MVIVDTPRLRLNNRVFHLQDDSQRVCFKAPRGWIVMDRNNRNAEGASRCAGGILHIPHASKTIPDCVRKTFLLSDSELHDELIRMTDSFADELFVCEHASARRVVFPVSRLVVDPERFPDDHQEPMAAKGMGAVYRRTSDGRPLRKALSNQERRDLIATYYQPHHEVLTAAVQMALVARGCCLILDCHSFSSKPLPHEPDQSPDRPDICIGADEYHTPGWLSDMGISLFGGSGYRVAVNRPFSGTLVPETFRGVDPRVLSIMIEVNRSLYMDERTGERHAGFDPLRQMLERAIARSVAVASDDMGQH